MICENPNRDLSLENKSEEMTKKKIEEMGQIMNVQCFLSIAEKELEELEKKSEDELFKMVSFVHGVNLKRLQNYLKENYTENYDKGFVLYPLLRLGFYQELHVRQLKDCEIKTKLLKQLEILRILLKENQKELFDNFSKKETE